VGKRPHEALRPGSWSVVKALDASQRFTMRYATAPSSGNTYVRLLGYQLRR
jgi:hypothetical protein